MPLKDPEARREYHRDYMKRYLADPDARARHLARVERNNERYRAANRALIATFKERGCRMPGCGESEPCALVGHHVDPAEKKFSLAESNSNRQMSPKKVAAELAKCVCLCANCHRKLHAGISLLPEELARS